MILKKLLLLLQELQLRELRKSMPWRSDDCRREFLEEEKKIIKKIIGSKSLKLFFLFTFLLILIVVIAIFSPFFSNLGFCFFLS